MSNLDALWDDLIFDALASDGPIRDSDVKDAVKRARPKIEAEADAAALPVEELARALETLWPKRFDDFETEAAAILAEIERARGGSG